MIERAKFNKSSFSTDLTFRAILISSIAKKRFLSKGITKSSPKLSTEIEEISFRSIESFKLILLEIEIRSPSL